MAMAWVEAVARRGQNAPVTDAYRPSLDTAIAQWRVRVLPDRQRATIAEARAQARVDNALALEALSPLLLPASEVDDEIPADADDPGSPIPIRILRPAVLPGGE